MSGQEKLKRARSGLSVALILLPSGYSCKDPRVSSHLGKIKIRRTAYLYFRFIVASSVKELEFLGHRFVFGA